jgi:hypothetical protein
VWTPAALATVFTSSTGDPANCHAMCEALASTRAAGFADALHQFGPQRGRPATGTSPPQAMRPATSLGAFDASFAAGLLEAAVQCVPPAAPVLLVACDVPYPEPLHGVRPVADVMAVALVLVPTGGRGCSVAWPVTPRPRACAHAGLETLRGQIPAARALPLLQALAGAGRGHAGARRPAGAWRWRSTCRSRPHEPLPAGPRRSPR